MPVRFCSTRERPYGCVSNFSRHGFELDGEWWPMEVREAPRRRCADEGERGEGGRGG